MTFTAQCCRDTPAPASRSPRGRTRPTAARPEHGAARRARSHAAARRAALLGLGLALCPAALPAQALGTVSGVVLAAGSAEPVVAATVSAGDATVRVDERGRFVVRDLPPGRLTLRVRALGYRPDEREVMVAAGAPTEVTIVLEPAPVTLNTVRTRARSTERQRFELEPGVGIVSMSGGAFQQIPSVGEADVLRAVQLLPGVVARSDFSAGYNVRGGESDQNLVLLDGIPVYNPFHLGGMFGTFIEPTVREITLLTGAFPAPYGGRLSSVLEVTSAEEARRGVHGSVGVSLLATSVALGGATPDARGSWNVAARRTYADALARSFTDRLLPYHFHDVNVHASHLLPWDGTIAFTGYLGDDVLAGTFSDSRDSATIGGGAFDLSWGNRLAGVSVVFPLGRDARIPTGLGGGIALGDSAWLVQRASISQFQTALDLGSGSLVVRNHVREYRLQGSLTWHRGTHAWSAGYEASSHDVRYRATSPQTTATHLALEQRPTVLGAYLEDSWRAGERLLLRPGVRVEHVRGAGWTGISPRLSAKLFVTPDLAVIAGAGQYAQWMHSQRDEDLPVRLFDFWIGSDEHVGVSVARQVSTGVESWLSPTRFVRVEGYYKRYDRLHESNEADDPALRGDEFTPLDGDSYGVDVLARQLEAGRVGGWIAYTYGVSRRRDGAGRAFWPAQDRRHTLNVVASWRPRPRVTVGARFGYASGTPYTPIVGQLVRRVYDPATGTWDTGVADREVEPVGGARNSARYPAFQRLDLSVQRRFERGNTTVTPFLQVVNAYNARNVFTYTWDYTGNPPTRKALSQFPILPTVGVTVDF